MTLEWETTDGDRGDYTGVVTSEDDEASVEGTVFEPTYFEVIIDVAASSLDVMVGEEVEVVATIENLGDITDTQDILFEIDGVLQETVADVELAAGQTEMVSFTWQTDAADRGSFVAEVGSDDDSDTAAGNVSAPANFEVAINELASSLVVEETEVVEVIVTVENTGDLTATQDITLEIGGVERDVEADLELTGGASQDITLQWFTEEGDANFYTALVASDDATDSAPAQVTNLGEAPAFFRVTIDEAASTLEVDEGGVVELVATVENLGDLPGTQNITLELAGAVEDTEETLELDAGTSQTVTLQWQTEAGDGGPFTAVVSSESESNSAPGQVNGPAFFVVIIDEAASDTTVVEGQTVTVSVLAENTGDLAATQDITLEIDGFVEALIAVQLDGGASQTIVLEWTTEPGDIGGYTAEVISADTSESIAVVVNELPPTSLSGTVVDATGQTEMEGVEVLLLESGSDLAVDTALVGADGTYEFTDPAEGDYDLLLQAPGLEPNYEVDEAGGESLVSLSIVAGENTQDFTVDWIRTTTLYVDGGFLDFLFSDPNDDLIVSFPECTQQADGTWQSEPVDTSDNTDLTFDPDECFQFQNVGVELLTGELDVEIGDILFPKVELYIDDSDDAIDSLVNWVEVDFDWLFDGIGGQVDFTTGSMELDIDLRILVGGTVNVAFLGDLPFGARDGFMDCQLSSAWGGDVSNPQSDTQDAQIGDYLHDPILWRVTTGESGPVPVTGQGYDSGVGYFIGVDNAFEIGRLSEGPNGVDDPGGASCGDLSNFVASEDFASVLNGLLNLPGAEGDMLLEMELVIPQN